jgi:hypothetical protein
MANNEIGQIKGTIYQKNLPQLTNTGHFAAPFALGSVNAPFTSNSKILGVTRTLFTDANPPVPVAINGLDTIVQLQVISPPTVPLVLAGQTNVDLWSADVTNLNFYTVYWCNEGATDLKFC